MGPPHQAAQRSLFEMSPHCLLASLLLLPAASQAAAQERGLFGDVLGGILGGENATAADAATDAATDAAPSDIVGSLMQVIPAILAATAAFPWIRLVKLLEFRRSQLQALSPSQSSSQRTQKCRQLWPQRPP